MPLTDLRKWSTTVIKDKSTQDSAQIPATSSTIDVYNRGATVSSSTTVSGSGGTATVAVYDTGDLEVNSTVQVGTDDDSNLTVTAINSSTSIAVRNDGSSIVALGVRSRLVITSARPTLYYDNTGTSILSSSGQASTDSRGFIEFYITLRVFDYIITSGSVKSLATDEESGQRLPRRAYYNVMDWRNTGGDWVQKAIAAVPRGRKLFFPTEEGPFQPPTAAGWELNDAIHIFSDGKDVPEDQCFQYYGTGSGAAKNSVLFNLVGDPGGSVGQTMGLTLEDCVISGTGAFDGTDGTGDAIRAVDNPLGGYNNVLLNRVKILYPGRSCVYATGGVNYVNVGWSMHDCLFYGAGGHGLYMTNMHMLCMSATSAVQCKGMGIVICAGDATSYTSLNLEGNCRTITATPSTTMPFPDSRKVIAGVYDTKYNAQMLVSDYVLSGTIIGYPGGPAFNGIQIESWLDNDGGAATYAKSGLVFMHVRGGSVHGFEIGYPGDKANSVAIGLYDNSSKNVIHPGAVALVDKVVSQDSTSHSNIIFPYNTFESSATSLGRLDMPTNHRNVIFMVNRAGGQSHESDQLVGIALPNLNTAAGQPTADVDSSVRIEGLMCYNSNDNKLYVYDGTNFIAQA